MTNQVQKMSASYKAIFIFSIFMVFFVLIAGAATQSKSSGLGIWIWGYTAWLMYKRRNSDLASFYKVILWFDIIAAGVVISVIAFSDNDVSRYIEYSLGEAFFLFTILISITYSLFKYFTNLIVSSNVLSSPDLTDDALWEQVSAEFKNGNKVDSLWMRAFSESDGNTNKANARYIKLRVEQLAKSKEKNSNESVESTIRENGIVITKKKNNLLKILIVTVISAFVILITYQLVGPSLIKQGPLVSYMGINLNSTMDDVQYTLGSPSKVFDVDPIKDDDGTIWGLLIAANKEKISSNKGINNFFYWTYEFTDYDISVGFDPSNRKVISIACYVSDSSVAIPKECEILKLNVKGDESAIKDRLGKPSKEILSNVSKTLYYKDLNINLRFIKKRLYNIIVGAEDIAMVILRHNQRINNDVDYCIEAKINARGKFDDLALKHGAINVKTKQEVLAEARLTCLSNARK